MKVTKVTREYFQIGREKVYFGEPLDHDLTIPEMQRLWNDAQAHVTELLERTKKIKAEKRRQQLKYKKVEAILADSKKRGKKS